MTTGKKLFEIKKTFGLGVLLKLTKKNIPGIEITTTGNKFTSNVTLDEMSNAVNATMKTHNIRLKIK
ncbi:MAG: hypothetical protein KKF12_03310 [Proteobacteria bacterium]|nr:hypothetical protein [Desulfobacula sp.]MBU3952512.1 hypothetical protein [Pseudomonadota bacterium]MBU4129827.1 hypothetical protein [Pseudomonadota bacterium]